MVLFVVLVASVALALYQYRWLGKSQDSHPRAVLKMLPVLLLSLYALAMHAPPLLAIALALAALGNLCLAYESDPPSIAGLLAFLLAHIAYAALFLPIADLSQIISSPWRYAFAWLFVMLAGSLLFILWRPVGKLALPISIYSVAVLAMALSALAVRPVLPGAAAALFVFSDTGLGLQRFVVKPVDPMAKTLKTFVWFTFYVAQLVFTLAIAGMPRF